MQQDHLPSEKRKCHRCGFTKKCRSLVTSGACERWINIQGRHPQTDEIVNQWNCIDDVHPWLMIENSKLQRETGAAVESFRNEMVKSNEQMAVLVSQELRNEMLAAVPRHQLGAIEHRTNGGRDDEAG